MGRMARRYSRTDLTVYHTVRNPRVEQRIPVYVLTYVKNVDNWVPEFKFYTSYEAPRRDAESWLSRTALQAHPI